MNEGRGESIYLSECRCEGGGRVVVSELVSEGKSEGTSAGVSVGMSSPQHKN